MSAINIKLLTDVINDTKDAVDKSAFGPMFVYPDETDFANKQVNQLAWTLFANLVTTVWKDQVLEERRTSPDCT